MVVRNALVRARLRCSHGRAARAPCREASKKQAGRLGTASPPGELSIRRSRACSPGPPHLLEPAPALLGRAKGGRVGAVAMRPPAVAEVLLEALSTHAQRKDGCPASRAWPQRLSISAGSRSGGDGVDDLQPMLHCVWPRCCTSPCRQLRQRGTQVRQQLQPVL